MAKVVVLYHSQADAYYNDEHRYFVGGVDTALVFASKKGAKAFVADMEKIGWRSGVVKVKKRKV